MFQNKAGVTATWYLLYHVLFRRDLAYDLSTSIHGILEATRRFRSLLLLYLHIGQNGVPLLYSILYFGIDGYCISTPTVRIVSWKFLLVEGHAEGIL